MNHGNGTHSGTVIGIFIAETMGDPMAAVTSVHAVPGKGLQGDRYFKQAKGTYIKRTGVLTSEEATLIEAEAIEGLKHDTGIELALAESRRNIVTRGIRLNDLKDKEFVVGGVRMKGIRLCEPCSHLEKMTQPGVMKALVHRGGLRAQILTEGSIRVGDTICECSMQGTTAACA